MKNDSVIYQFPEFMQHVGNWGAVEELIAIGFSDVNQDGRKDLIVNTAYVTGVGPNGMEPRPLNGIYLNQGLEFDYPIEVNEALNSEFLQTIGEIRKYLHNYYLK